MNPAEELAIVFVAVTVIATVVLLFAGIPEVYCVSFLSAGINFAIGLVVGAYLIEEAREEKC